MLLVYGPRSASYDFGPAHPLTPRRFGPGIGLLRALGAEPGLVPQPAPDEELLWCHTRRYVDVVRGFSRDPFGMPEAGIAEGGDDPPFAGMHEAGAMVAGGSLRAVEAVMRGAAEHAFHPGGGLHHAMPDHASGFCIYDDPALAIARARRDGLRVLYVDLDVHHGDGVQAIHLADPGVLTISFHESGRYLFPGTGGVGELGDGLAAGTSVNVPMEPGTGEGAWLAAISALLPDLAAAFGPDLIVSQHGADSHAWDPLAHLRVTTTAMGEAARLVDLVAHRYAGGRWLATGGGGYDAYRVVPRSWSLVWLAGAHREVPSSTPVEWRQRWASEGARYGQTPLPATFEDVPNAGLELDASQTAAEARTGETARLVRRLVVPRLIQVARDRGWWDPLVGAGSRAMSGGAGPLPGVESPTLLRAVDASTWAQITLEPGVVAPSDPATGHRLIEAAIGDGALVAAAVAGTRVVGLAVAGPRDGRAKREHLVVGVAPAFRRQGLATRLLDACVAAADVDLTAEVTVAERDPIEPLDRALRATIARQLLERAGFEIAAAADDVRLADPGALRALRRATQS
ncbi:MAG: acetoin utilization protein AcuC [Chloroflexota bacterium]|nr:acetoin utilization protein AcuC [Chloroflexota bacterium]